MKSVKTASLYVCAILGAGFATGKELYEYFAIYGSWGIWGILISSLLFGITAYKVMNKSIDKIQDIFPISMRKVFSLVIFIFLIVLYSAMLSASGELFKSIFNMPKLYGTVIMTVISLVSLKGECIKDISLMLFPIIIIISIITGIYILIFHHSMPETKFNPCFIPKAIVYSAYNIITAAAVLLYEKNKKTAFKTALISGISIFILAAALSLPLILNSNISDGNALPLLSLIQNRGIVFYMYVFMLTAAVYTTAVTSGMAAVNQYNFSPLIITLAALLISFAGFEIIVSKIYFIFGIMGIAVMIFLIK